MELKRQVFTAAIGGEPVSLEVSTLAGKANAAVIGRYGDTTVLATAVMGDENLGKDYFPLTVDYEERFYAAGKILGSRFIRREGRPSDDAILSSRLIDRTIRPLFDEHFRREVQVVVTVLAYDERHDPDVIGLLATSTALGISDIPWNGPVAGVKVERRKPDGTVLYQGFFAGPKDRVNMIEFEGSEVAERDLEGLFETAQAGIDELVAFQGTIVSKIGKLKTAFQPSQINSALETSVHGFAEGRLEAAIKGKQLSELTSELVAHLRSEGRSEAEIATAQSIFEHMIDRRVRTAILERDERPDGRRLDEVRELYAEVGFLKRAHGSGLFIRGDTQILAVATLATPAAEQLVETMEATSRKRFMLHYNFPSFATGETGRSRSPGRREIGHGALAAKAIVHMLPAKDRFPYTIRIVAETLSSNGSSSMASTCAASLALMDAGVPLPRHIAGIAMGLVTDDRGRFKILTDIQGPEDYHGDMDLKVAGTANGVTAVQMDVKVSGITKDIFSRALEQAGAARTHVLEMMERTLPAARPQVSPYAPMIMTLTVPKDKIGLVIGPGGRTINGIIAATDNLATIDIDEDGTIFVASTNHEAVEKAYQIVKQLVREYRVGEVIEGTVVRIMDFGAIVDLGGDRDGMVHVSELRDGYVKRVEDVVQEGDHVRVKVIRADQDGKIGLSMRGVEQPSKA